MGTTDVCRASRQRDLLAHVWSSDDGGHRDRTAYVNKGLAASGEGDRCARTQSTLWNRRAGVQLSAERVEDCQGEIALARSRYHRRPGDDARDGRPGTDPIGGSHGVGARAVATSAGDALFGVGAREVGR